jgi:hypothetical protein
MKRIIFTLIATIMLSGFAYATPITLTDITEFSANGTDSPEDLVDYGWGDVNRLDGLSDYVSWKHQFTFQPPAREIVRGTLKIYLADDAQDCWLLPWEFAFGYAEDGTWDLGEVDTGSYKYGIDVSFLEDGEFDVTVASLWGDFIILKSELEIRYEPVPEPSTLLLLGGGLLGLGYLGSRRRRQA